MMQIKTIKDIAASIKTGKTPPSKEVKYFDGAFNWYTPGDLDKTKNLGKSLRTLTEIAVEEKKAIVHKAGTLLIGCIGDIGKLGITTEDCSSNQQITGIYPKDNIDVKYLYYWFRGNKKVLESYSNNAVVPILNNKTLETVKLPIPPLDQQKKIAAILDAADGYRQKTKALIAKYDELTQSLFLDMFGDPVTNPKGWENKTIEDITIKEKGSIKRGPFGGALKKEIFVEEGYLVYEQYHALNNDFTFARYFIDEAKFQELKGFEVKSGDIIISCSGVYLGKLAIVPEGAKAGIINQALLKVTLDQSLMTNHFFTFHFRQKNFRETFFDANRGAGIPNFPPMSSFKKFPFIVPPIEEQNKFEERVQAIETQKAQAQASLDKAEDLFNSLLQKAFKGELA